MHYEKWTYILVRILYVTNVFYKGKTTFCLEVYVISHDPFYIAKTFAKPQINLPIK